MNYYQKFHKYSSLFVFDSWTLPTNYSFDNIPGGKAFKLSKNKQVEPIESTTAFLDPIFDLETEDVEKFLEVCGINSLLISSHEEIKKLEKELDIKYVNILHPYNCNHVPQIYKLFHNYAANNMFSSPWVPENIIYLTPYPEHFGVFTFNNESCNLFASGTMIKIDLDNFNYVGELS